MDLNSLTALSSLDGRYRSRIEPLAIYFSEFGYLKIRVEVEIKYYTALTKEKVPLNFSLDDALWIKNKEAEIKHDVKAIEYFLKSKVKKPEFIHFGLTSDDINSLAYGLMLKNANEKIIGVELQKLTGKLKNISKKNAGLIMLARTHGQPAVPTTLGKETANFFVRIEKIVKEIKGWQFEGKLTGAVGNLNALVAANPKTDWVKFSNKFVGSLGLKPNIYTTQILPYDNWIEYFSRLKLLNYILIGFCQDMWRYISDGYFSQVTKVEEVGSSTMPQKVNPIDFENAEGNLGIANTLFEYYERKLPISRLQRDLSDSTVKRTFGLALGYSLLSYQNIGVALEKIIPNGTKIAKDLDEHWEIVSEGIQTILRSEGVPNAYEQLKNLSRGKKTTEKILHDFINDLNVSGSQWGDEGKGKIVDFLSQKSDYVVRFHGGNNAGHTIINKFGKFALHLVPSGICYPKTQCLITNGVILDLKVLLGEIEELKKSGVKVPGKLFISPRAHIIMPYHKILDGLYEKTKDPSKQTGTTGRGIGPCYADKVSYNGLRVFDLLDHNRFEEKLSTQLVLKNKIIIALGGEALDEKSLLEEYDQLREKIKPYVKETTAILQTAVKKKKNILFEGAQGILLDVDFGTYPFCSASSMVSGAVNGGSGLSNRVERVVAISKAYTTRVGGGPFPTELDSDIGEKIRQVGGEFGATTGRARKCGWLDLELVKTTCQLMGATEITITKLDVLSFLEKIKVGVGYTLNGKKVSYLDIDAETLGKVKVVYKEFSGWQEDITKIKKYTKLPSKAKKYLDFIEKYTGVKIGIISVGPDRTQTILKS
ncbi:adenylosuccinate synthase [Candidatus Microgenomates bacterium]|nr:adenylosuccinate synthase [Candidatus Microgenomates bacterium]